MEFDEKERFDAPTVTLVRTSLSSWIITFIGLSILFAIAVAMLIGDYSKHASTAGWLKPDKGLIKVMIPQFGNVEEVYVDQGDEVFRGQPIATINLDTSIVGNRKAVSSSLSEIDNQIEEHTLSSEILVLQAEQTEKSIRREINSLREELSLMFTQQQALKERASQSKQLTLKYEKLSKDESVSLLELIQRKEQDLILQQSIAQLNQGIVVQKEKITSRESELQSIPLSLKKSLSETRRTISNLRENKFNLAQQGVITLVSPIDGRVAAIPVTEGVAVAQNDLMATILPAGGKLEAELFVPSKDASLVKIGQKVRIKYHGFPYQRYGVMTGSVDSFSKTIFLPSEISGMFQSNEPAYRIIIELDQQEIQASDQTFPLQSGMTLDADIVYGREKLWRLFFQER